MGAGDRLRGQWSTARSRGGADRRPPGGTNRHDRVVATVWFGMMQTSARDLRAGTKMAVSSALCTSCSERAPLFVEVQDLNQRCSDATFSYYRCSNCHLIFLYP